MEIRLIFFTFLIISCTSTFGQQLASVIKRNPDKQIENDSSVRIGKLSNGITYYLKNVRKPSNKLSIKWVVRTGALYEEQNEIEISHWLEHLVLRGPAGGKINAFDYFALKGLQRGSGVNGTESFTHTTFTFMDIPIKSTNDLFKDISFISECIANVPFDSATQKSEAGAVIAEGMTADSRSDVRTQLIPKQLGNTKYSRRIGIPPKTTVGKFTSMDIKGFYKKWYTSDRMGIFVVGDMSVDSMEYVLQMALTSLNLPKSNLDDRELMATHIPAKLSSGDQVIVIKNAYLQENHVEINYKQQSRNRLRTYNDFYNSVISDLYNEMASSRLKNMVEDLHPPVLFSYSHYFHLVKAIDNLSGVAACTNDSDVTATFLFIARELERIKRYGFTEAEFAEAKKRLSIRDNGASLGEGHSDLFASFIENYINGSAIPSGRNEKSIRDEIIENLKVSLVNEMIRVWMASNHRDVVLKIRSVDASEKLLVKQIMDWLADVERGKLDKVRFQVDDIDGKLETLSSGAPARGAILKNLDRTLGVYEYQLANGITVFLKPVPDANDVSLRAVSKGGIFLYKENDRAAARYSASLVGLSDIGGMKRAALDKFLTENGLSVFPAIDDNFASIWGRSMNKDIGRMIQIVSKYLSAGDVINKSSLASLISQKEKESERPSTDVLQDTINSIFAAGSHGIVPTINNIRSIDIKTAQFIYNERFIKNVDNFTFVLAGNFDPENIILDLNKYLGALNVQKRPEVGRNENVPIHNPVRINNYKGPISVSAGPGLMGAKVQLFILGQYPSTDREYVKMETLVTFLNQELTRELREVQGQVYFVHVDLVRVGDGQQFLKVNFQCNTLERPKVDRLIAAVVAKLKSIRSGEIDPTQVNKALSLQREIYLSKKESVLFADYLVQQIKEGRRSEDVVSWINLLSEMTAGDIKSAANTYINEKDLIEFILL